MKATVLLLFVLYSFSSLAQTITPVRDTEEFVVNHYGEKQILTEVKDKILIKLSSAGSQNSKSLLSVNPAFQIDEKHSRTQLIVMDARASSSDVQRQTALSAVKSITGVETANYMLEYRGAIQGYTNEFIVRLLPKTTAEEFQSFLTRYGVTIKKQFKYSKGGYVLELPRNSKLALFPMIEIFENSKLFKFATPNFYRLDMTSGVPPNDTHFGDQWALSNSGQNGGSSGSDIRALLAWDITTGRPDIRVAVIDQGVDLDHEDLENNLLVNLGFDATGDNTGGGPSLGTDIHGTACAGIVGAIRGNGTGVAGVAPNVSIIPIRALTSAGGVEADLIDGLEYAVSAGVDADILSCSWGGGTSSVGITDAVNDAAVNGRNGLGSIVVFAAGNSNRSVNFPATLPNAIAVGALSMCDERKRSSHRINQDCPGHNPLHFSDPEGVSCDGEVCWGSCFGPELDIMAPGVLIPTTTNEGQGNLGNGNYVNNFNGTSAATPHVAGVAALMLSVNPCLTREQLTAFIELSATRLINYCYSRVAGHPNGAWNEQMGHGQLDAYKAVQMAYTVGGASGNNVSGTNSGALGTEFVYHLTSSECLNRLPGFYKLRKQEVTVNITYPQTIAPFVVASSNGMTTNSPYDARSFVTVTNVTETSATLTTEVYEARDFSTGSPLGWFPTSPGNVRFDWAVGSTMLIDSKIQNITLTGTSNRWAMNEIVAGSNVAIFPSPGPVVIQSGANVTWRARNEITIKNSTTIQNGATFHAVTGPFFTCTSYPNGRIGAAETLLDSEKSPIDKFELTESKPEAVETFTVSPNPFSDSFVVSYTLNEPGLVRIEILDAKGITIAHFDSEEPMAATGYKFKIDVPNLAPGIYIINLKTSSGTKSIKVVGR